MRGLKLLLGVVCVVVGTVEAQTPPQSPADAAAASAGAERPEHLAPGRERSDPPSSPLGPRRDRTDESAVADTGTNGDVIMSSPWPFTATGVLLQAKPSWPFVVAKTGSTDGWSAFVVFNSANTELMRVASNGRVGIGTPSPQYELDLVGGLRVRGSAAGEAIGTISVAGTDTSGQEHRWTHVAGSSSGLYGVVPNAYEMYEYPRGGAPACCVPRMRIWPATTNANTLFTITGNGAVGIRRTPQFAGLEVHAPNATTNTRATPTSYEGIILSNSVDTNLIMRTIAGGVGQIATDNAQSSLSFATGTFSEAMRIDSTGRVGLGIAAPNAKLHVVGNIIATGSITGASVIGATYQDLAEWVPATTDMAPGTVVILNPDATNEVMPSNGEYDVRVAGVVSEQPGIILGVGSDTKEQIATTGRVRVRVDATAAPIRVGDLLVTSNKSGRAMRSEAVEIHGRRFHQPGTIIGKALEPLASGEGEILVLLSMQ